MITAKDREKCSELEMASTQRGVPNHTTNKSYCNYGTGTVTLWKN